MQLTSLLKISLIYPILWKAKAFDEEGFADRPDGADRKMRVNDRKQLLEEEQLNASVKSGFYEALDVEREYKGAQDKVANYLGKDAIVSSPTSSDMWKRLHDYIKSHLDELLVDGFLGIQFQMRYSFCMYIVMFIPAEVVFPIPGFYKRMIPAKSKKIEIIRKTLEDVDKFFSFIKEESKTSFIINVTFGVKIDLKNDLQFILEIPKLIKTDPGKIIRWLLRFQIKAAGYKPGKSDVQKLAKNLKV